MRLSIDYYFEVVQERANILRMASELGQLSLSRSELGPWQSNTKVNLQRCEREIKELEATPSVRRDLLDFSECLLAELAEIPALGLDPAAAARREESILANKRNAVALEFAARQLASEAVPV